MERKCRVMLGLLANADLCAGFQMTVTTSVFPEVSRCDVIQILTLIVWSSPPVLLFMRVTNCYGPVNLVLLIIVTHLFRKGEPRRYAQTSLLHELKRERPTSIVITKKLTGQKYP